MPDDNTERGWKGSMILVKDFRHDRSPQLLVRDAVFKSTVRLFQYDIYFQGGHEVVGNQDNSTMSEHDPHFEPIITLPEVTVSTMEEEEIEMIKLLVFANNVTVRFRIIQIVFAL